MTADDARKKMKDGEQHHRDVLYKEIIGRIEERAFNQGFQIFVSNLSDNIIISRLKTDGFKIEKSTLDNKLGVIISWKE